MSNRFGEKSRGTQPITGFSQRPTTAGGGALTFNQQQFLAPGTWTKPANTSQVWVFIVGGGGGGSGSSLVPPLVPVPSRNYGSGGGGGGVRSGWVPVSAPVSVTIGAGGNGGNGTLPGPTQGSTAGGTTSFGPTFSVGGGGAGASAYYTPSDTAIYAAAPTTGGGAGGAPGGFAMGGQYGSPSIPASPVNGSAGAGSVSSNIGSPVSTFAGGGAGYLIYGHGGAGAQSIASPSGRQGSGAGAGAGRGVYQQQGGVVFPADSGVANTGGGGGGGLETNPASPEAPLAIGGNGGSGYCLVRWLE